MELIFSIISIIFSILGIILSIMLPLFIHKRKKAKLFFELYAMIIRVLKNQYILNNINGHNSGPFPNQYMFLLKTPSKEDFLKQYKNDLVKNENNKYKWSEFNQQILVANALRELLNENSDFNKISEIFERELINYKGLSLKFDDENFTRSLLDNNKPNIYNMEYVYRGLMFEKLEIKSTIFKLKYMSKYISFKQQDHNIFSNTNFVNTVLIKMYEISQENVKQIPLNFKTTRHFLVSFIKKTWLFFYSYYFFKLIRKNKIKKENVYKTWIKWIKDKKYL